MPESTKQANLVVDDLPLNRRAAERIAEDALLEFIGTTPTLARVRETKESFTFDLEVAFPRVITDETGEPQKTRFLRIGNVGEIQVDRFSAKVIQRPRYFDVQQAIRDKLGFISQTVEKALVKVAADEFSALPFPLHLHTPFVDVLCWLLTKDRLSLEEVAEAPEEPAQKLISALEPLRKVGLIDIEANTVVPGPILIGLEQRYRDDTPTQLAKALAHFFREGYNFLDSIRQVLGPHLALSGILYEKAVEMDKLVPLSWGEIEKGFSRSYAADKRLKLPRYLVQLASIGVARREVKAGVTTWGGVPAVFQELQGDAVLDPVGQLFV